MTTSLPDLTGLGNIPAEYSHIHKLITPAGGLALPDAYLKWYEVRRPDAEIPAELADDARQFLRSELVADRIKFKVGRIVYLSLSPDETVLGFAYPKEQRAALIAAEPAKFHMPVRSDERYNWVRVWLASIDEVELRELIIDAWCMVVP